MIEYFYLDQVDVLCHTGYIKHVWQAPEPKVSDPASASKALLDGAANWACEARYSTDGTKMGLTR